MLQNRSPALPLRPFGAAEIMDGAVRLVRGNFAAAMAFSVPVAIVTTVLTSLLSVAAAGSTSGSAATLLAAVSVRVLTATVLAGLLAPMFSGDLLGAPLTGRQNLTGVGRAALTVVMLGLVVALVEGAGLVALGVGGAWLWGSWSVAAPVCVLERTGVRGALRRSFRLVQPEFWRTWGIRALGWVLTTVLGLFVTVPFQILASYLSDSGYLAAHGIVDTDVYIAVTAVGTLISAALLAPVSAAVDLLLYTDLRMRTEGLDIALALPSLPALLDVPPAPYRPPVTTW